MTPLDGFSSIPDHEPPMFSAGLSSASIDWSHYDGLDFNNENFGASSYSQAPSFTGFDFSSIDQPALTTTSTSGEISEVEDFVQLSDNGAARSAPINNHYGSDFDASDFGGDIDGYRLSTASSYIGMPQTQMLASNNIGALDMDTFLKGVEAPHGYSGMNHGHPSTNYAENNKIGQTSPPFDDTTNFQLLPNEDENDSFWMHSLASSNNVAVSSGRNENPDDSFWAQ